MRTLGEAPIRAEGIEMSSPLFFALPGNEETCELIALFSEGEVGELESRSFPDDESYVRVATDVSGREAVIVCTLNEPNAKALPLIFLADALHELGARRVGLVAPYLAYMRQDARFHAGEAITSRSFADLLSERVDWLVSVDPHLHRIRHLSDIYGVPAVAVHASRDIGRWIAANVPSPLIIGPDEESAQWVRDVAIAANAPSTVLTKARRGDMEVVESIPNLADHPSRVPVLVDDIISTGRTMIAALDHLREQGAPPAWCIGVHAVFAGGAYRSLQSAGAAGIITTTTIPHSSNRIDVAVTIGVHVRQRLNEG
jgi:ribose-phosphate pyrophosphokinase